MLENEHEEIINFITSDENYYQLLNLLLPYVKNGENNFSNFNKIKDWNHFENLKFSKFESEKNQVVNLLDNFNIILDTIDAISQKLYVNWLNCFPRLQCNKIYLNVENSITYETLQKNTIETFELLQQNYNYNNKQYFNYDSKKWCWGNDVSDSLYKLYENNEQLKNIKYQENIDLFNENTKKYS